MRPYKMVISIDRARVASDSQSKKELTITSAGARTGALICSILGLIG